MIKNESIMLYKQVCLPFSKESNKSLTALHKKRSSSAKHTLYNIGDNLGGSPRETASLNNSKGFNGCRLPKTFLC